MSNDRSPREVCSTTMGISGLMRWAPIGWCGSTGVAGRPELPRGSGLPCRLGRLGGLLALLLGRPQPLARLGLRHRDGGGSVDQLLDGLLDAHVLAEGVPSAVVLELVQQ